MNDGSNSNSVEPSQGGMPEGATPSPDCQNYGETGRNPWRNFATAPPDNPAASGNADGQSRLPEHVSKHYRVVYIWLGIVFGSLAAHDAYAGYMLMAKIKWGLLALSFVISIICAIAGEKDCIPLIMVLFINELWALFDIIITRKDAAGRPFDSAGLYKGRR